VAEEFDEMNKLLGRRAADVTEYCDIKKYLLESDDKL
jgi:hypothetical protein